MAEIGGGEHPIIRPNIDLRPMPTVDVVANVSLGIPLQAESLDGLYASFILEHMPTLRVRHFIAEVHRILAPGGVAVLITANLEAQVKRFLEAREWNESLLCMIFGGDPPYEENFHRTGFSPAFAHRLFKEAGFYDVKVFRHPHCETDMIIQVLKGTALIIRNL